MSTLTARSMDELGVGMGKIEFHRRANGTIPYVLKLTRPANIAVGSTTMRTVAQYLRERSCIKLVEVDASTATGLYITVRDTYAGSCSAGGFNLNYDGCGHRRNSIIHELSHILGVGHEHQRVDTYRHLKILYENILPAYHGQYTPKIYKAPGEYDWESMQHYPAYGFNNGNGSTYIAEWMGFKCGCREVSEGFLSLLDWVTQHCWEKPLVPRCSFSGPRSMVIGSRDTLLISFMALYGAMRLNVSFSGLPSGSRSTNYHEEYGAAHVLQINPVTANAGKTFNLSANFTATDGASVVCFKVVSISSAEHVCNGTLSTDPSVCSGHGKCNSSDFPRCSCPDRYGGPWCEGTPACPQDISSDFNTDIHTVCSVGNGTRIPGPDGLALNATEAVPFAFVTRVLRQPHEVSFLLLLPEKIDTQISVRFSGYMLQVSFYYVPKRLLGKWLSVKIFFTWSDAGDTWSRAITMINGAFYRSSYFPITKNSIDGMVLEVRGSWAGIDRFRMRCSPQYVSVYTRERLTSATLLHDIGVVAVESRHPDLRWNVSSAAEFCTCPEDPQLIAHSSLRIVSPTLIEIIVHRGSMESKTISDRRILCTFGRQHFEPPLDESYNTISTATNEYDAAGITVSGLCAENVSYVFSAVTLSRHLDDIMPRPARIRLTLPMQPNCSSKAQLSLTLVNGLQQVGAIILAVNAELDCSIIFGTVGNEELDSVSFDSQQMIDGFVATLVFDWDSGVVSLNGNYSSVLNSSLGRLDSYVQSATINFQSQNPDGEIRFDVECPAAHSTAVQGGSIAVLQTAILFAVALLISHL